MILNLHVDPKINKNQTDKITKTIKSLIMIIDSYGYHIHGEIEVITPKTLKRLAKTVRNQMN
jgi:hypothetical protein